MNVKRCLWVVATVVAFMVVAALLDVFVPSTLAPSRILDGGTRAFIAASIVLVAAMMIASSCRRAQPGTTAGRAAKSDLASRNKNTR